MTELVPLLSIAKLPRGTEPGSSAYAKTGNARFLRVSDLTGSRESPVYVKASPDLVISNTTDTLIALDGTPGVVAKGISGAISSGIRRVDVTDSDRFAGDFIYYALQSAAVQEVIRRHSKGVTIKHASAALKDIKIPYLPMSEQLEMIKRLRVIERIRENQKALAREVTRFHQEVVDSFLDYSSARSQGWEVRPLRTVCDEIYRYPTFYGFNFVKKGVPVLKISNFSEADQFESDLKKYDCITEAINRRYPKTILRRDDLVMGVRGTYIGKCVPVPSFLEGANMSPNLIRMSPDRSIIRPRFLWHFTCSQWWGEQVASIVHYWKLKFGTVRADQLKEIQVPLPSLKVQDLLLQRLEQSLALMKQTNTVTRECNRLYSSVLDYWFMPLYS